MSRISDDEAAPETPSADRSDPLQHEAASPDLGALIAAAGFLIIPLAMVAMAFAFNEEARRLPLVVGVPLVVLATLNLIGTVRRSFGVGAGAPSEVGAENAAASAMSAEQEGLGLPLIFVLLVALVAAVWLFGLIGTSVVFIVLLTRFAAGLGWLRSLVLAIVVAGSLYAFDELLNVPIHGGRLGALLPF